MRTLRPAEDDPGAVLAAGEHAGYPWVVMHNGKGCRCGYVGVPPGHPWHGRTYQEVDARVHGGLTWSDGDGSGTWFGFDCMHPGDAPDPALPIEPGWESVARSSIDRGDIVWDQGEVEAECASLCDQAARAASSRSG